MKRSEFLEQVTWFGDLIDFCYEEDCYICENIMDDDAYHRRVDECIVNEWVRNNEWETVRDILNELPSDYDYYEESEDSCEFFGLDDEDFHSFKSDVLEWADCERIWEPEEENAEPFLTYEESLEEADIEAASGDEFKTFVEQCSDDVERIREEIKARRARERARAESTIARIKEEQEKIRRERAVAEKVFQEEEEKSFKILLNGYTVK